MSESSKAVFLSYASQDAEAAKRIADALRGAGVEVWFDAEGGLEHGDEWDAKIRRKIKECVLFIPLISANTQAREEGYFRLEWELAAQRSLSIASGVAFILPVVIDETREVGALVPDRFRAVQWTKIAGGNIAPEVLQRFLKLWSHRTGSLNHKATVGRDHRIPPGAEQAGSGVPAPQRHRRPLWPWIAVALVAALFIVKSHRSREVTAKIVSEAQAAGSPAAPHTVPAAPVSEARKLANQAMQLLEDPNFTRESSWLADELCARALTLEAGDAEVWSVAAFASHNLYANTYDHSASRREKARSQAARASQLDPRSVRAALAVARCLEGTGNGAEIGRTLRELHSRVPDDQQVILSLLGVERRQGNEAAVQDLLRKLRALPRTGVLPYALWLEELRLRQIGRYAEAEAILDEMLSGNEVLRGAYYEKLNLLMHSWHDVAEAGPFIEKIPVRFRQEPAFGSAIAYYHLWRREPELALRALNQVPQDYFEEYAAREPKALLTGWAHAVAARPAAAQAEWRNALALVDERLKSDGRNFTLLEQRALLLALTGQAAAAREAWRLRVELGGEERPPFDVEGQVFMALGESEVALTALESGWARSKPGDKGWQLPALRNHPAFAPLQSDLRMQRLVANGVATLAILKAQQTGATVAAPPIADKSVAVLAFANLSDDKANEYFSDGISEELLNVLAKVPGLKVSARTSAFYFKGKDVPIPEIAQKLGVAYVIEGSVRKAGDKVRITAQLIKATDGFHVWSDTFTRDLKDIFAVQDEIAGRIAQELSVTMGIAHVAAKAVQPEVFDLYIQARQAWNLRNAAGYDLAESLLNRAIELDPKFARAHAALADVWITRAEDERIAGLFGQRNSALQTRLRTKAELALALDKDSAEAHATLGLVCMDNWEFPVAEKNLRRAIELNPNYASGHQWLARILGAQGRMEEGLDEMKRAIQLDPLSSRILDNYGGLLRQAGRLAESRAAAERAIALQPDNWQAVRRLAALISETGRIDEALNLIVRMPDAEITRGLILARAGRREEAEALLTANRGTRVMAGRVQLLLALGKKEAALDALISAEAAANGIEAFLFSEQYDPIRSEPKFQAFLAELGQIEAHARAQAWRAAHTASPVTPKK